MRKNRAILLSGNVHKVMALLALPMVMGVLSKSIYNITDTYFVAQLGTAQLAAMSFTFPVVRIIAGINMGVGIGTASVVSRAIGEGNEGTINRVVTHSLILGLFMSIVFMVAGFLTIDPLFRLLGATDDLLPLVRQYMLVWYLGIAFMVIPMIGNNCIRATGNTTYPSVVMLISAIINIVLDPIFIFGLFGFPRLELTGAAVATLISRALTFIAAIWFLHYKSRLIEYRIPRLSELLKSWKQISYIAVPAASTRLLVPVSLGVVTRLAAELGPTAVAAFGAGIRITSMAMVPLRALGTSMIPFIGQNWGAKMYDRVQQGRASAIYFSMGWGIFCAAIMWILAAPIARAFSGDPDVLAGIILFLRIDPIGYGPRGVYVTSQSMLNAINKPYHSALLMGVRLGAMYIPLAYIGMKYWGLLGMFMGMMIANILSGMHGYYLAKVISLREQLLQETNESKKPDDHSSHQNI